MMLSLLSVLPLATGFWNAGTDESGLVRSLIPELLPDASVPVDAGADISEIELDDDPQVSLLPVNSGAQQSEKVVVEEVEPTIGPVSFAELKVTPELMEEQIPEPALLNGSGSSLVESTAPTNARMDGVYKQVQPLSGEGQPLTDKDRISIALGEAAPGSALFEAGVQPKEGLDFEIPSLEKGVTSGVVFDQRKALQLALDHNKPAPPIYEAIANAFKTNLRIKVRIVNLQDKDEIDLKLTAGGKEANVVYKEGVKRLKMLIDKST